MADLATQRVPLGKGWHNTGSAIAAANYGGADFEGTVRVFPEDKGPSGLGDGRVTVRSLKPVTRVLVRNVSAGNLLPKRGVTWATGYRGKRVDGYSKVDGGEVAGYVDEYLPATGVPSGDLFWLVVQGPCLTKMPYTETGEDVAVGDYLMALTAATSGAASAGRVQRVPSSFTADQTTDGTMFNYQSNKIGRALSAKTTGNTDADILADVNTWIGSG